MTNNNNIDFFETVTLTIEMWTWLREHPGAEKKELPYHIVKKIRDYQGGCPLCEINFIDIETNRCIPCFMSSQGKGCASGLHEKWVILITYLSGIEIKQDKYDESLIIKADIQKTIDKMFAIFYVSLGNTLVYNYKGV